MTAKIRLGIYGGTFSPPHIGHVRAAEAFLSGAKLDRLIVMPTFLPPHKDIDGEATAEERLEMCQLAFGHLDRTEISDFEVKKGGKSYTYLTLTELSAADRELYFLVGTDMFLTLDGWKCPEIIFKLATVALVRRETDRENGGLIAKKARLYEEKYGARLVFIYSDVTELSSSELRERLRRGDRTEGSIPPPVHKYIRDRAIYRSEFSDTEIGRLRSLVGDRLSEERYLHTLGVERAARAIGKAVMPEAVSELAVAALLHDIAKEISCEEQTEILKMTNDLTKADISSKKLYHAFCAPYIIKRDFSEYATKRVLSSAFNHTAGDDGMSLFDEIIFVADYVEDGRRYSECIEAREELFSSFDSDVDGNITALHRCAMRELQNTVAHIKAKGADLNPRTKRTLEFIKSKIDQKAD